MIHAFLELQALKNNETSSMIKRTIGRFSLFCSALKIYKLNTSLN